jgi:hypothetical protein
LKNSVSDLDIKACAKKCSPPSPNFVYQFIDHLREISPIFLKKKQKLNDILQTSYKLPDGSLDTGDGNAVFEVMTDG